MPTRLTTPEVQKAAVAKQIETAALLAVVQVETGGRGGFLPNGWVRILFERHWLWKRLGTRGIDPAPLGKQRPDLCGVKWDPVRYPYGGEAHQWDRVAGVIAWGQRNDPEHWESYKKACYEACSWGLFQLMGFHYETLGYPNVYEFKHAQESGEPAQLSDALRWMEKEGLLGFLRERQWAVFARRYNGPGQVKEYAARLASAYRANGGK